MSESREFNESNAPNGINGHTVVSASGVSNDPSPPDVSTDLLIVGTGPAGASLACFLASHGQYFRFVVKIQNDNVSQDCLVSL
jgi:NADPH-dependent 2,4-dienoyl-CoA reductase/sulfur reductase-like enzyme